MSPELFDRKLTKKADIWAIGCIVLQFITGKRPYHSYVNEETIPRRLFHEKETPLDYAKKYMRHELLGYDKRSGRKIVTDTWWNQDSHLRDFIEKCLQYDYDHRPTAAELLNHPFLDLSEYRDPNELSTPPTSTTAVTSTSTTD